MAVGLVGGGLRRGGDAGWMTCDALLRSRVVVPTMRGWQGWQRAGWAPLLSQAERTRPGLWLSPAGRPKVGVQAGAQRRRHPSWQYHQETPCPPGIPLLLLVAPGGPQRRWLSGYAGDDGRDASDLGSCRRRRRPRAWEASLSPLERVSRMLPEEFLLPPERGTPEAQGSPEEPDAKDACVEGKGAFPPPPPPPSQSSSSQLSQGSGSEEEVPGVVPPSSSKNIPFQVGDLILAEVRRKHYTGFKKMCMLKASGSLPSSWGVVKFAQILGKLPGQMFPTSTGALMLIRRPSLEEYVLFMKRGPTITYPKDVSAMLLLMDISHGDVVLEAGSGSGAMSLFLSRAVGPQGHVRSYEIRKDHHQVAKKNYQTWTNAWKIRHTVKWPDNVEFINKDIVTAAEELKPITFDIVFLDLINPPEVLPTVFPSLKQGGICTVYLANVTQVVELLEAIRMGKLDFFCEQIIEVTHRDWLILPAVWKQGGMFKKKKSEQTIDNGSTCHSEHNDITVEEQEGDESCISNSGKMHYIARPHPWQIAHTGFLVKLRKFNPAELSPGSNGAC